MSKPTPPKTPSVTDFNGAMARLDAADRAVITCRERIAALEARAAELDVVAIQLEHSRGKAYSSGELEDAAAIGKRYAANRAEWADAHTEIKARNLGMDGLMVAVLDAEDAADSLHGTIMEALYKQERAALIPSLKPALARAWRIYYAAGNEISFDAWCSDLIREIDDGYEAILALDVGLPISEVVPRSSLLPGNPRRGDQRRADLRAVREKLRAAGGVDLAQQAA